MKTNQWMIAMAMLLGLTSCSTNYRMISRINPDGSMHREIYAYGDSAFLAGDRTHNPFLFKIDDALWEVSELDSVVKFSCWGEEEKLNVKASRTYPTVGAEGFGTLDGKDFMRPLAVPQEKLQKRFRWFYTYYIYTATYSELPDKGPVSLDVYMSREEQQIWFRGGEMALNGMNGIELNNTLDDLESKFWKWYNRTLYELNYEVIRHFVRQQGDTLFARKMENLKEPVFGKYYSRSDIGNDASPEDVCRYLDEFGRSTYFLNLYEAYSKPMNSLFDEKGRVAELFDYAVQFEVSMPGRVTDDNAALHRGGSLIWKVDAFRLLYGDYTLTAESRTVNYWAFAVTIFLLLLAAWWGRRYPRR